jgi:hypothetical protein
VITSEVEGEWGEVLSEVARLEPEQGIQLAVTALGSDNSVSLSHAVEEFFATIAPRHPEMVMTELGMGLLTPRVGRRIRIHDLTPVIAGMPIPVLRAWLDVHGVDGARAVAGLLPAPTHGEGALAIPEATELVMGQYGDDEDVFDAFCMGTHYRNDWCGDMAARYDSDAESARRFMTHPSRWVSRWAAITERYARRSAEWSRIDDEEIDTP